MSKKQKKRNTKKFRKNVKKRNPILKSKLESTQIGYKNRMVDFTSINTPTTVEEFRDNLLKYYFSNGRSLYVNELGYVDVDEINSMKDISDIMWDKYGEEQFQITPLVIQTKSWKSFSE